VVANHFIKLKGVLEMNKENKEVEARARELYESEE
jgi:hypothetical protein